MAKSKAFFGLRRGSTKAFTFQVLNGAQITKDRVTDVKNPRTRAQMAQRMIMATAGSAYKHMRAIIDHAFEGVSYGQKSYSEFMRLNVHDMVEDVRGDLGQFSYNPYGDERLYPSPFIMSRGSLKFDQYKATFSNEGNSIEIRYQLPSDLNYDNNVDEIFNRLGWKIGDMVTYCFMFNDATGANWKFGWIRFYVKDAPAQPWRNVPQDRIIMLKSSLGEITFSFNENYFIFNVDNYGLNGDEAYGTAILSRKSNNKWLRSNSHIIFPGSPVNSPTAEEALATYPVGTNYILNGANIGGGGIAPDTTLRMVSRFPVGSPIDTRLDDGSGIIIATFNKSFNATDLVGKLSCVFWDFDNHQSYFLNVVGVEQDGHFILSDSDANIDIDLLIDGVTLKATDVEVSGMIFDIDFDSQHKKEMGLSDGLYAIQNPVFGSNEGFSPYVIIKVDSSQSTLFVCVEDTGDPWCYKASDSQIDLGSWFDLDAGTHVYVPFVDLINEVFNIEYDFGSTWNMEALIGPISGNVQMLNPIS